ncbi:MAG: SpoIIE family protein phosphatase [Acidobacteria bacterium]|nr:SpoIIE family protein phosphatase [Acidobacteriota bacterium]
MPSLLVRLPDGESREVKTVKTKTSIGRSSRNDICINDPFASRLHAEVRHDGSAYFLTDLGSANGTFCNNGKVTGTIPLNIGDIIQIGETKISLIADPIPTSSNELMLSDLNLPPEAELTIASGKHSSGIFSVLEEVSNSAKNNNVGQTIVTSSGEKEPKRNLLEIVSKVGVTLLSDASLDDTLKRIMELVFEALPVERGFLFLSTQWMPNENAGRRMRAKPNELVCKVARNATKELTGEEIKISRSISEKVIKERTSVLTSDASHDPRFQEMQSIVINQIRSIMAVPLVIGEKVMGMIYAENPYATRFNQDDLLVLTTIASVAAIKIENARLIEERIEKKRMEEELKVASEIQIRLQPLSPPRLPNYDMIGISFPCREIGGDYYDFIHRKNGRILLALGDVSGKGMGAALMMSSLHAALHAQAQTPLRPAQIVTEINKYIFASSPDNKFLTLFCAELDVITGELFYSNAGHNPPILVSKDGNHKLLESGGLPIGITDEITYETNTTLINPGDVLVIYSDGITDSVNERDEDFGENRLIEVIRRYRTRTASKLRDQIEGAIAEFMGPCAPIDDTTIVIVKRTLD